MYIESLREYCLSLPMATEDMAFGDDCLLFRVCGKIFACYSFVREDYFVVKTDPDYAIDLRDRHPEIEPAWHWNKKYWSQIGLCGHLTENFVKSLIRHSYARVVENLPKRLRTMYPEITAVEE